MMEPALSVWLVSGYAHAFVLLLTVTVTLPVSGARVWNALLSFVTDSSTISPFKRHLKTYLFARSQS